MESKDYNDLYEIKNFKTNYNNIERIIPYKIHQTFKISTVPKKMYDATLSYKNLNPNYDYYFYDDNNILSIIDNFDCSQFLFSKDDLKRAYTSMNTGAGKADIFRYIIVYLEGGCYFDIDTVCLNALDTFIQNDDELVSGIGFRHDLHQWGLIYKKEHPFIKKALENSINNINNKIFVDNFINSLEGLTGPPCLDKSIKEILCLNKDYKFTIGKYTINNFKFNILNGDYFGGNIKFKYDGYFDDLKKIGVSYWGNSNIYCS